MTASELNRKLLYCGYDDLADYLKNSSLHRYIYQHLLVLKPQYDIKTPILTIFNEVYFQCVNVQCDRNPGLDIRHRYLIEEADYLGAYIDADLVFSIVWAFMKVKRELSFAEEYFMRGINLLIKKSKFKDFTDTLIDFIEHEHICFPYKFAPMPCPTLKLPQSEGDYVYVPKNERKGFWTSLFGGGKFKWVNSWQVVTEDYNYKVIEWLVSLYSTHDDKINLLRMIKRSLGFTDNKVDGSFIDELRYKVENGIYIYPGMSEEHMCQVESFVEQYKQERDTYKYQFEQLKKNYEADLENIEAKYQAEIAALKRDLDKKTASMSEEKAVKFEAPEELYMTINEIVSDAKEWFHESGASELTNMLYRYIKSHEYYSNNELWEQIASIIPAVEKRTVPHQTVEIPHAGQVNIKPQQVITQLKEEKNNR